MPQWLVAKSHSLPPNGIFSTHKGEWFSFSTSSEEIIIG